jgi:hypothetical protein
MSFITIEGGTPAQIKKAANEWIILYAKSLPHEFKFTYYKNGTSNHVLVPDHQLKNELFNFLVNYLTYPMNIRYKVHVRGYTTISDANIYPREKLNYEIEVFIPSDDTEYDNVFAVTEYNEVFKTAFGGKTIKTDIRMEFTKPDIDFTLLTNPQIIKIKKTDPLKEEKIQKSQIIKRIRLSCFIIPCVFMLSYLTIGNLKTFMFIHSLICFGISYWFITDYKMLQWLRFYTITLAISIIVLVYSYVVSRHFPTLSGFLRSASVIPPFILLFQLPLRLTFKKIFKREPVVDSPAPSTSDFIYSVILIVSSFLIFFMTL